MVDSIISLGPPQIADAPDAKPRLIPLLAISATTLPSFVALAMSYPAFANPGVTYLSVTDSANRKGSDFCFDKNTPKFAVFSKTF